jgi:hypothetical protein
MLKRLLVLLAALMLLLPAAATTQAAAPAIKPRPFPRQVTPPSRVRPNPTQRAKPISGTLSQMSGSVLTLAGAQGVSYTVNVSSTTKIVRLYNGASALDELSPGDALQVWGTTVSTNTINAVLIKDESIQRAYTRMAGTIDAVSGSVVSATVTTDLASTAKAPFAVGQVLALNVGPSTNVISPTATGLSVISGTAALTTLSASVGQTVTVLGVYDRVHQDFTSVFRIRLFKPGATLRHVGHAAQSVTGTITAIGGTTAPTSFTLQTSNHGLITVTVAATTTVVRRFNGKSSLDELTPGDSLGVTGSFADAGMTTFAAATIKDFSIQEAATRAILQVSSAGFNTAASSFAGTVQQDPAGRSPLQVGSTVTVTVGASTKVLMPATPPATGWVTGAASNIQANQKVLVLGLYNRKSMSYIETTLVRILPQ